MGGYIYINEGTLDFVQSDDELAGIIGHETGHIERRHAVTAQNKASILNVIFGVARCSFRWCTASASSRRRGSRRASRATTRTRPTSTA